MNNSFKSLIDSANSLLILLPNRPYFDQVAAGLGLYLSLKDKQVEISCPTQMTVEFNRLVGVNKITSDLGSKNLTLRFKDYRADDIEKVSYDIENAEFRLTIIPKAEFSPPKKDQIEFSYSGVSADTALLIGGANSGHFPAISDKSLAGVKFAHIGTKAFSASPEKGVMSFARPASSVSEIIAFLLKESGLEITSDIGTNLLMGLEEASNKFSGSGVNADTFEIVAYLMRKGATRKPFVSGQRPPVLFPRTDQEAEKEKTKEGPPKDWIGPKIYKGSSIS